MIEFKRYPHVRDLIEHYAKKLGNAQALDLLETEISSEKDALVFGRFVLTVIDSLAKDKQNNVSVLGSTDNTSMIPDIDYEVSLYFANRGFEEVWEKICYEE